MVQGAFFRVGDGEEEAAPSAPHERGKPVTLTDCLNEQCAYALLWGMPYDLFWYGPLDAFWHYMKKYELEREREKTVSDFKAWRQGLYFRDALASVYHIFNALADKHCKKIPYPDKPYGFKRERTPEEEATYQRTVDAINAHNLILQARITALKRKGHAD